MATDVDVANMALGHVSAAGRIESIDELGSEEARRVRQYWDSTISSTQRVLDWTFCRRYTPLAPVTDDQPPEHWSFLYAYPDRCERVWFLLPKGYERMGTNPAQWQRELEFEIVARANGARGIATHLPNARARWAMRQPIPDFWDPLFVEYFAYQLAKFLVPSLAPATNRAMIERRVDTGAVTSYQIAASANGNEQHIDPNREPDGHALGI